MEIVALRPSHMSILGIDSTKLEAYSRKDMDAGWGYDHINHNIMATRSTCYTNGTLAPICYTVTPANKHDNTQTTPLIKRLGARLLQAFAIPGMAYDAKKNVTIHLALGILFITMRNQRGEKTPTNKYRLQDYHNISEETLDRYYKNRMDCEHANISYSKDS
ncbi:hypothetical protein Mtc_1496 [Methanocella conradii HZ254]|uniref:Transposase IS4-like domain-containing protein n=2 Tax=Methanocella TaxID=570266 RepID=H8I614_METCZ|nr:hypothetical protein Mtc_1496 [Methanocella conradii HZ254]